MKIAVAGPYSSDSQAQRRKNLEAMNSAAAQLLKAGHIPLIGINAALAIVEKAGMENEYPAIMSISLAVIEHCDALVLLAESPGANKERDLIVSKGKPVFSTAEEAIEYFRQR